MNTKQLNKRFARAMYGLIVIAMVFSSTGSVFAQEANPRLTVSITYDWFRAEDFPPNVELAINIFASKDDTEPLWRYSRATDSSGFAFWAYWQTGTNIDLTPGMYLVVGNETATKDIVLEEVTLDVFDPGLDYLAGTAPPSVDGRFVWVGTGNDISGCGMDVVADPISGSWEADFSAQPCNVTEDMWGAAQVFDADGDATEANPSPPPPNPHFTVFPEWEWFDGLDWPDGASVTITVKDKPECETTKESWDGFFNGNFGNGCDIVFGDTVTFTDGTTTRSHVVQNLYVTNVDINQNAVRGKADAGTTVYVWPHDAWFEPLQATADDSGEWQVNLGDAGYTLREDSEGRSEIRDEMGNATASDWHVIHPRFTVFPEWEWFDGNDWPNGATVTITVVDKDGNNKPECETTKESWGYFFNGNFGKDGEGCDVEVGDEVTFDDDTTTLSHTVRNLTVTSVDVDGNTVGGTADYEAVVQVWPHETGEMLEDETDNGTWQVDFTNKFDIVVGTCGRSQILDGVGNATAVDWCAPKPWLIAFPEFEAVEGWEWPAGNKVTLTIDQAPGFEMEGIAQVTDWGDPRTYVRFDFGGEDGYDLQIGDTVTLTGEDGTVRSHTVQNLSVTDVNAEIDTISGIADNGVVVMIWPHGYDQIATLQTTTVDSIWQANFTDVGFNLVSGIGGRSTISDESGNWTAVDWNVPMAGWQQINDSGFGNPQTVVVSALEMFRGELYAGSGNWDTGGEIWRTGQNDQWVQVNEGGFGSGSSNPVITDMLAFQGKLYIGTGLNSDSPGQVWRSPDGLNWQPVTTNGFGDGENNGITSFVMFKSMLYASTSNANGSAQIWRSSTGDGDSWEQVAPDGSGAVGTVTGFGVYGGALYAAIEPPNATGAPMQIWRSTNGSDWVTITDDGFGDGRNESTGGFAQFGGYLYLGTQNGETGAQLWRTKDGLHWEQVVGDGFGDQNNIKIESLLVYGKPGYLYAATKNIEMGMQVWRSIDGTNWEQLTANGFGDGGNFATLWNNASVEYQGNLLFGTWNYGEGGEVWRFAP